MDNSFYLNKDTDNKNHKLKSMSFFDVKDNQEPKIMFKDCKNNLLAQSLSGESEEWTTVHQKMPLTNNHINVKIEFNKENIEETESNTDIIESLQDRYAKLNEVKNTDYDSLDLNSLENTYTYQSFSINSEHNRIIEKYKNELTVKKTALQLNTMVSQAYIDDSIIKTNNKAFKTNMSSITKQTLIQLLYKKSFAYEEDEHVFYYSFDKLNFGQTYKHLKSTAAQIDEVVDILDKESIDSFDFDEVVQMSKRRRTMAQQLNPIKKQINKYFKSRISK